MGAALLVILPRFLMLVSVDDFEWVTAHGLWTLETQVHEAHSQCDTFLPRRQPIACCPSVDLVIEWTARHFVPASNDRMDRLGNHQHAAGDKAQADRCR